MSYQEYTGRSTLPQTFFKFEIIQRNFPLILHILLHNEPKFLIISKIFQRILINLQWIIKNFPAI